MVFAVMLYRNAVRTRPAVRASVRCRLDPQRLATREQRRVLYRQQHGCCWVCHRPLRGTRVECHHVIPWSRGGRTALPNLRLVHAEPCHAQLTAQQARLYGWRRRIAA